MTYNQINNASNIVLLHEIFDLNFETSMCNAQSNNLLINDNLHLIDYNSYSLNSIDLTVNTNNVSQIRNENSLTHDDVNTLNNNLSKSLRVFNEELMNVCTINNIVELAQDQQKKTTMFLKDIVDKFQTFKKFINSSLKSDIQFKKTTTVYIEKINDNIKIIQNLLDTCLIDTNDYYKELALRHVNSYNKSKEIIKTLDSVFTLIKYNKKTCPICLQNEVEHFVIPCGHTYCSECSEKITNTCFICRQNIYKISSLYYN